MVLRRSVRAAQGQRRTRRGSMQGHSGSAPHAQPSDVCADAACHPISCMYEFPSVRAARPGGSAPALTSAEAAERAAGAATARGQPAPAPGAERAQRAKERPLQDLTVHWQRLHSLPRGAHGRLARAAEAFAHAAMTAQDTGLRRHALQSLVRELDRQHAALVTRLSRERRDCPHTTQLRNWVVHVKRRVSAVMKRASAPLDAPDRGGVEDAGHGRWPPPRAANLDGDNLEQLQAPRVDGSELASCLQQRAPSHDDSSTLSQFVAVAEEEVKEMDAPPGADHAQDIDTDDVADDALGLRQFAYVPGARRAGQSSAGARAGRCGREDLAAASAAGAEASLLVRGLEGLCSPGYRGQPAGSRATHGMQRIEEREYKCSARCHSIARNKLEPAGSAAASSCAHQVNLSRNNA
jgi:hypothetical protein